MPLTFGVQIPYLSEGVDRSSIVDWVRLADEGRSTPSPWATG